MDRRSYQGLSAAVESWPRAATGSVGTANTAQAALARTKARIEESERQPRSAPSEHALRAEGSLAKAPSSRNGIERKGRRPHAAVALFARERRSIFRRRSAGVTESSCCGRRSPMTLTSERISELRAKGRRAAVATLVATTGGAIRRLGETMWVDDHGTIVGSVTIGGCVDGRAVELAEDVLRSGESQRVSLALGDEDAWAFGMTCAGNVDLLVEAVDVAASDDPIARTADAVTGAIRNGRSALEVVSTGTTPRRLVVIDDGTQVGTLGSAALDGAVSDLATDLIE